MPYGFIFPGGNPRTRAAPSREAAAAGWDGVFVPDSIAIDTSEYPAMPVYDPWVTLAAIAMRTERVKIGAIITPMGG